MKSRWIPVLCWVLLLFAALGFLTAPSAQAGFWGKVKDLYEMPDKVNELQQKYDSTMQQLNEQQLKLQEARQQNAQLQMQLEQMKLERESTRRTWISIAAAVVLLVVAYVVSVRIWRFTVWRKQRNHGSGQTLGS